MSVAASFFIMKLPDPRTITAGVYCRKSTESEDRQILSLPAQRDEADKLTLQLGIKKVVYYEEAKSAKVSGNRAAFSKMISHLKSKKINVIVCWKLDRLARNMVEGGQIIDLLQRGIIKAIITPFKTYYPDESALILSVEFGVANQYSRDLSQNVSRGMVRKAQMGSPNGQAVIGFRNDKTGDKGSKLWIVDEDRLPIVKEIFSMYLSGNYSGVKICAWAKDVAKLTTPMRRKRGNKFLSVSAIYRMLAEPIYAGYFYFQGERYELSPKLPRIITIEEHRKILRMLGRKNTPKTKVHETLYRGYITSPYNETVGADVKMQLICDCKHKFAFLNRKTCPKCGKEIALLNKPKYLFYTYYRNKARSKRGESTRYISEQKVTEALVSYMHNNLSMSIDLKDFCLAYIEQLEGESNEKLIAANRLKRIEELKTKKIRYRTLLIDDLITREEYLADVERINNEIDDLSTDIFSKRVLDTSRTVFSIGLAISQVFTDKAASIDEKRFVLSQLGANLQWNEKTLIIIPSKLLQCIIDALNEAKRVNKLFEPKKTLAAKDKTGTFQSISPIMCRLCENVRNLIRLELEPPNA